jgi:hypothetical protein
LPSDGVDNLHNVADARGGLDSSPTWSFVLRA